MARENFQIVVTEKGAKIVRGKLEKIGTAGKKAQGGVKLLNTALGTLAVTAVVTGLVRMVDTYTNLQNRLRLVTTGTENLGAVTSKLFGIANATRTSYEGTATLYARVALAAKNLGRGQQELLNFTESVNQAIILSGASAIEANAGLIQLSQGLASGALRGDELRSVLEQIPLVADVIAEHLGVTRGELRKMGEDGEISAEKVLNAFKEARVELAERFAQSVPTISQAFTVLSNSVLQFVGQINTASGVGGIFANTIILIAGHVEILAAGVLALSVIIGINLAKAVGVAAVSAFNSLKTAMIGLRNVIPAIVTGLKLINTLALKNPFVVLALAVVSLITILVKYNKEMIASGGILRDIGLIVRDVIEWFQKLWQAAVRAFEIIKNALQQIGILQSSNGEINVKLDGNDAAAKIKDAMSGDEAAEKIRAANKETRDQQLKDMADARKDTSTTIKEAHTDGGEAAAKPIQRAHKEGGAIFEAAGVKLTQASASMIDSAGLASGNFMTASALMLQIVTTQLVQMRLNLALTEANTQLALANADKARAEARIVRSPGLGQSTSRGVSNLVGFAQGGSFSVGGSAGVDNNLLSINNEPVARVTRGEQVTVSPQDQGGGGPPVQVIMNIQTPDAASFQRSQSQILARAQSTMSRASARNN